MTMATCKLMFFFLNDVVFRKLTDYFAREIQMLDFYNTSEENNKWSK